MKLCTRRREPFKRAEYGRVARLASPYERGIHGAREPNANAPGQCSLLFIAPRGPEPRSFVVLLNSSHSAKLLISSLLDGGMVPFALNRGRGVGWTIFVALALIAGTAGYIVLRWRRSPRAFKAMIAVSSASFAAGAIVAAWIVHLIGQPSLTPPRASVPNAATTTTFLPSPAPGASPAYHPVEIPPLNYDPAHAALPDARLTPGDVLPGATAADICTPGWASEHRHVTESMRDQVYAEYGRTRATPPRRGGGVPVWRPSEACAPSAAMTYMAIQAAAARGGGGTFPTLFVFCARFSASFLVSSSANAIVPMNIRVAAPPVSAQSRATT